MDFLMNTITALGGVIGILIGALVIGVVIAVGVLPILFISKRNELTNDPSGPGVNQDQGPDIVHKAGSRAESRADMQPRPV